MKPTTTLLIFALTLSFNGVTAHSQSAQPFSARNQKMSLMNRTAKPSLQTANPALSRAELLDEVQKRAFRFFWEKLDPDTGLVNDRSNNSKDDDYTVASIASPLGRVHVIRVVWPATWKLVSTCPAALTMTPLPPAGARSARPP